MLEFTWSMRDVLRITCCFRKDNILGCKPVMWHNIQALRAAGLDNESHLLTGQHCVMRANITTEKIQKITRSMMNVGGGYLGKG